MKQVVQSARRGTLALVEVPAPKVRPGTLAVRTRASVISAGTERLVVDFARKNLAAKARARPDLVKKVMDKVRRDGLAATLRAVIARLDEPLPLGYAAAGEVVAVGHGLEGVFRVGQRVAMAGAGAASHAEVNVIPASLAAAVPDGVVDEEAAFATLAAIAMHGVRNLGLSLGDVAAVVGTGLIGLLAVQLLALAGARVVALDVRADRLALARRLGAELTIDLGRGDAEAEIGSLSAGRGADGVLIAAASPTSEPLATAAAIARDRARVVLLGMTGTEVPYREFMHKEISLIVSRSYGPGRYDDDFEGRGIKYPVGFVRWTETENLAESLRLMALAGPRRLDAKALITHRIPLEKAAEAYDLVLGPEPHLGVVLTYGGEAATTAAKARPAFGANRAKGGGTCVVGVIGAGAFARSVLLPALKRVAGVTLRTVVARRGAQAEAARERFGFTHAAADAAAVLEDPEINAVIVATRHDSHADLCARALAAGKAVLVEKPLALDRDGLNRVAAARNDSPAFFQVGFNRRFAPLARAMRRELEATAGPRFVVIRVNAGRVASDSWVRNGTEGGGRILGEACHFIDLARYLVGAPIAWVQAEAAGAGPAEDVTVTLTFADGSLATIAYTALGDAASGKERIEAFAGGRAMMLDDFRSLAVTVGGRARRERAGARDKGFEAELDAFVRAAATGGPAPVDEAELIETSLATIAAMESLAGGGRIRP